MNDITKFCLAKTAVNTKISTKSSSHYNSLVKVVCSKQQDVLLNFGYVAFLLGFL